MTRERDVQFGVSVSRASAEADSDMHVRARYKTVSAQCQVVSSFKGFAARSNELLLLRDTSEKPNSFLMHGTRFRSAAGCLLDNRFLQPVPNDVSIIGFCLKFWTPSSWSLFMVLKGVRDESVCFLLFYSGIDALNSSASPVEMVLA